MFDIIKSNPILWVIIFLAVVAPSFLFGAMKLVAFIILGLIILLFILGLIFRVKIQRLRKNMEDQMHGGGGFGGYQQQNTYTRKTTKEEGDVKIFVTRNQEQKRVKDDIGDYVDFEDIKENH
ncbi:MAG: DUF4834 family protein [Rikenellaceae bacterium]